MYTVSDAADTRGNQTLFCGQIQLSPSHVSHSIDCHATSCQNQDAPHLQALQGASGFTRFNKVASWVAVLKSSNAFMYHLLAVAMFLHPQELNSWDQPGPQSTWPSCYAGSDASAQRQDSMSENHATGNQNFYLQCFFPPSSVGKMGHTQKHDWRAGSGPWHVGAKNFGATRAHAC